MSHHSWVWAFGQWFIFNVISIHWVYIVAPFRHLRYIFLCIYIDLPDNFFIKDKHLVLAASFRPHCASAKELTQHKNLFFSSLRELVLDQNVLSILPSTLWELKYLQVLKLAFNRLVLPPDKFANMRALVMSVSMMWLFCNCENCWPSYSASVMRRLCAFDLIVT